MVVHPYNKAQSSQGQKLFHKRFIPETLKSIESVNHRNNPFIAHDSYFLRIMNVPISKSNQKIQCQYVLLKTETFFLIKTNRKQN